MPLKASCCSSGSTGGIGRLLPYERALVELSQDARYTLGHYQGSDFISGAENGQASWQLNHELHLMTRLVHFFQPFVKLPVRTQIGTLRTGSAFGDLSFGARWPLLQEHYFPHWPGVDIFTIAKMPTGNNMDEGKSYFIEELSGSGAWLLSVGGSFEKSFGFSLWTLAYTYSLEPRLFNKEGFAQGPSHAPTLSFSFPIADMHNFSFTLGGTFDEPAHYDGKRVRDSSRRKITMSSVYAWKFHSHMTLNFLVGNDIPISGLGRNNKSEIFGRVSMRVGVF